MRKTVLTVFNPLFVTALSWLTLLALYMLQPVGVLYPSNGTGIVYIACIFLAAGIISIIVGYKKVFQLETKSAVNSPKGNFYAKLFFSSALLEVSLKGLPPIFTGADYTSWGISGLHGFINVLGLYVSYWYFSIFLIATDRKRLIALTIVILVFLWQISVLNRAIMMLNLVGLMYIAISMKRLRMIHFIAAPIGMILLIGQIGDLRGMGENYIFLITNPKPWAEEMGVGFVWVVTYFTTAISNLMFNIEQGQVNGYYPMLFLNEFLPNIFKQEFVNVDIMLYEGNFNASTIMRPSFLAFGFFGPVITIAIIICFNILNFSREKSFDWFIFTTFLASTSVFSCYENTIFTPWLIFMLMLSLNFKFK
jgi:hypothetical protein